MPEGYKADLAYIHDVGHGEFAQRSAPGLLAALRAAGVRDGLVVDLGCGSGLWARRLVAAGYDVLGIDQSGAMLAIARRRVPRGRFVKRSFFGAPLPRCAAVTALGECFNYLFDDSNDRDGLVALFERVHDALHPGGLFVFDLATPGRGGGAGTRQRNVQGKDWAVLLETEEDPQARMLTRRITSFRRVGALFRRSEEVHRLRLLRPADVARDLRRIGFRVKLVRGYGSYRFPSKGWTGFIARRP